jgi:superfamily I DNA and RNA helicase
MAEMVPDRMPTRASQGEKRLFAILQQLPDDYIVYYEPIIENRYPDFIIIAPDRGLMVIEVKGWYAANLLSADSHEVKIKTRQGPTTERHPIRQARDYMYALMDQLRRIPGGVRLLQASGAHQNRFIFPFGHFAVLSNITAEQLASAPNGDFSTVFPATKVVTRDQLQDWHDSELAEEALKQKLQAFFDPYWTFDPLREDQIAVLRAAIHPDTLLTPSLTPTPTAEETPSAVVDLKVLDLKQENNVRNIGQGHRIIYGVAGSGKTVLLIAKARLLAGQQPDSKILLLCFNVALAAYLRHCLEQHHNITVTHFDGWAKLNGVTRRPQENNQALGERLLARLEAGDAQHTGYFDAVMIDEAQDFDPSWFRCALAAMAEPYDGDLIIVGDGSQGLYGNRKIVWKNLGIQAQGRTISAKFDLDKNYRNSREIIDLAAAFASQTDSGQEEETIVALKVDPTICLRHTGIKPRLIRSDNRREEIWQVLKVVKNWLDGQWYGREITPLQPHEIAIFYPFAARRDRDLIEELNHALSDAAPVIWLTQNPAQRSRIGEPGIKIQTIHSAKGLQYKAVVLLWADLLPRPFADTSVEEERKLMYVALTRPEDYLLISASGPSIFLDEIVATDAVE